MKYEVFQKTNKLTTKEKEQNQQYRNFFVNEIVSYEHELHYVVLINL